MDKILESYVNDFAERWGLAGQPLADQFHHFVNYCVVSRSTSDSFDVEDLSTEGGGDTGIDGSAIVVNGHLFGSVDDVNYFRDRGGRLDVEFIFVQSKSSTRFNAGEIGTFLFGVKDLFSDSPRAPANASIAASRELKDYIYNRCSIDMNEPPVCLMYYVTAGEWHDDENLRARLDSGVEELEATHLFSEVCFHPLDSSQLKTTYRTLRNRIESEILFEKHTILPQMPGVEEAYLGILPCTEFLRLITDEEGCMRHGLFYDNVRDF